MLRDVIHQRIVWNQRNRAYTESNGTRDGAMKIWLRGPVGRLSMELAREEGSLELPLHGRIAA